MSFFCLKIVISIITFSFEILYLYAYSLCFEGTKIKFLSFCVLNTSRPIPLHMPPIEILRLIPTLYHRTTNILFFRQCDFFSNVIFILLISYCFYILALRDNRIELVRASWKELTISISDVALSDEGQYTCSLFTMPVKTTKAFLTVLGKTLP